MNAKWSSIPVSVSVSMLALALAGSAVSGCKSKDDKASAEKGEGAAAGNTALKGKHNFKSPSVLPPKVPPQIVKEYRVDACYFGTLTLRQARDAYLASLGKAEPSEQKVPNFGAPVAGAATAPGALVPGAAPAPGAAAPAAGAAVPPAGTAAPSAATAAPAGTAAPKKTDVPMRASYERAARTCAVALGTKDFPMVDVDPVLAEYAPFAQELAKKIVEAHNYYTRGEYKQDQLARGKTLHKELVERFAQLDGRLEKLRTAIESWRKGHPQELSSEGAKTVQAGLDAGRALVYRLVAAGPLDLKAFQADVAVLEGAVQKVKAFGDANPTEPWGRGMLGAFETLLKALKESKPAAAGLSSDELLGITQAFTHVVEARQRAVARSLAGKPEVPRVLPPNVVPAEGAAPAVTAAPAPH